MLALCCRKVYTIRGKAPEIVHDKENCWYPARVSRDIDTVDRDRIKTASDVTSKQSGTGCA